MVKGSSWIFATRKLRVLATPSNSAFAFSIFSTLVTVSLFSTLSSELAYVINVIKTLQEEELIYETPHGPQIKIQNLTELGREVAEIIKSVQSCYELCDGLKHDHPLDFRLIKISPEKYLVRLQNMEPDGKNRIGIAILNHAAADYVRDFVIFKYLSLSRKYDVRKKKTTSQILEQIISDATRY
jgi:hypothetical protein